jgi:hypothetical protein
MYHASRSKGRRGYKGSDRDRKRYIKAKSQIPVSKELEERKALGCKTMRKRYGSEKDS